jgi:hypothetical protein
LLAFCLDGRLIFLPSISFINIYQRDLKIKHFNSRDFCSHLNIAVEAGRVSFKEVFKGVKSQISV